MLSLDNTYRKRYQEYLLATGEVANSRKINWRQVEWEKVIGIKTYIRDNCFYVTCQNQPEFKFFMNFRWAGREVIAKDKFKQIQIWTVGWSDGVKCFLEDYDFKLGIKIKDYVLPLRELKGHIHPRIINLGII